uniref:Uncharacterized protein n=1 Tax=Strigamia maritima TaxID=126957 RepID=T1JHN7_STRMM
MMGAWECGSMHVNHVSLLGLSHIAARPIRARFGALHTGDTSCHLCTQSFYFWVELQSVLKMCGCMCVAPIDLRGRKLARKNYRKRLVGNISCVIDKNIVGMGEDPSQRSSLSQFSVAPSRKPCFLWITTIPLRTLGGGACSPNGYATLRKLGTGNNLLLGVRRPLMGSRGRAPGCVAKLLEFCIPPAATPTQCLVNICTESFCERCRKKGYPSRLLPTAIHASHAVGS